MTPVTPAGAAALLARVRERRPLIHHITNVVTVNDVAGVTLALGASPVMAYAPQEVEEMVSAAGALALNIGTPTVQSLEAMLLAGRRANTAGIPIVLDPVGAGATVFRTTHALRLLADLRIACVRGNAGEIAALAGRSGGVRGVDAAGRIEGVDRLARELAGRTGATVAATGPVDVLTDGARLLRIENGHPLLAQITGSGCMATAAVAAFLAVEPDHMAAAASGLVCFEIAAERAAEVAGGPGTFRAALLDALAALDAPTVLGRARIRA
ncbi:MAG TPA: hydroxyethylthiazole kinase [bacterium]|nr:hydroxyethylthiazole kinase [bacterium]